LRFPITLLYPVPDVNNISMAWWLPPRPYHLCPELIICNSNRQLLSAVPPKFTTEPINQTTTEGAMVTFYCTASGYPNPKITWIKDEKIVVTGDTLRLNTSRNHSGEYWCSAENGLNETVKASASLNVLCKYFSLITWVLY